jgi:pre-mRNA-splicing factor ATP-dependent RNA helicase DHX15/PRP43
MVRDLLSYSPENALERYEFHTCRVLYQEFVLTTKNYIRNATEIRGDWLIELAPHYFDLSNYPENDTKRALERLYTRKK